MSCPPVGTRRAWSSPTTGVAWARVARSGSSSTASRWVRVASTRRSRSIFSTDETTDVGSDGGTPVSDDYGPRDSRFNGRVHWVQLDIDAAAEDLDHLISARGALPHRDGAPVARPPGRRSLARDQLLSGRGQRDLHGAIHAAEHDPVSVGRPARDRLERGQELLLLRLELRVVAGDPGGRAAGRSSSTSRSRLQAPHRCCSPSCPRSFPPR